MFKTKILALTGISIILLFGKSFSQNTDTVTADSAIGLDEIVITATQSRRKVSETPKPLTIVSKIELDGENNLSVVDALNDKTGIWVEKRTANASDPIMRGFAGYYIHALIDGHSLSTLAGEGGPAGSGLYAKIDPLAVERIEVIRGPSSILYGSNGIGGVINFITSEFVPYSEDGFALSGYTKTYYTSAANSGNARLQINGAGKQFRFLLGGTYQNVNDVRGGGNLGLLVPSSGQRYSYDFKSEFKLSDRNFLKISWQDTRVANHHRYYLPEENSDYVRQGMILGFKTTSGSVLWNKIELDFYLQNKGTDVVNANNVPGNSSNNHTTSTAANLLCTKLIENKHRILYGIHLGTDRYTDKLEKAGSDPVKPGPDAAWSDLGVFIQDEWRPLKNLTLLPAVRLDRYLYTTETDELFVVPAGFEQGYFDIRSAATALTGGLGVLYKLSRTVNATANVSRGFRQPNPQLSVKKFSYGVEAPNKNVNAETATTYELGMKANTANAAFSATVYYTNLDNFLVTEPGVFNDQDWFDWNGNGVRDSGEDVFLKKNNSRAWVKGLELEGTLKFDEIIPALNPGWFISCGFNWMDGYDDTGDQPLSKLAPARGMVKIGFNDPGKRYWFHLLTDMVDDYDKITDYQMTRDPAFREDPQDMGSGLLVPLPGYTVYTMRMGFQVSDHADFTFSVENITNEQYRAKDSRMDAAGVNMIIGLKVGF